MGLPELVRVMEERIIWYPPQSLGSVRITHVIPSSQKYDQCFFFVCGDDLTRYEYVFVPRDTLAVSGTVELIAQLKRWPISTRTPPDLRLALKPFTGAKYGMYSDQERDILKGMLQNPSNEKNYLYNRAMYRKFLADIYQDRPFPEIEYPGY